MPFVIMQDQTADPGNVLLLRAIAVVLGAEFVTHLDEKL
jgi:hypothetical protein